MDLNPAEASRISRVQSEQGADTTNSLFTALLRSGHEAANFSALVDHLKALSPAGVDLEIRSLDSRVVDGHSELSDFISALTAHLRSKRDFELVNTWMAVLLKVNSDIVRKCSESDAAENRVLRGVLDAWASAQQLERERLARLVGYCRGVTSFLRSV